ncbi:uncharacterized protein TNCV_3455921 [Trichonephila clavipes]|nr:uncharacterized protein TNCV_3455921 [Trichonephila clavipes]
MSRHRIRNQYEQLSEFYRARIIGLKEIGWANWRVTRYMGRSDADNRSCRKKCMVSGRFQRHDGSGRPSATAVGEGILIIRSALSQRLIHRYQPSDV